MRGGGAIASPACSCRSRPSPSSCCSERLTRAADPPPWRWPLAAHDVVAPFRFEVRRPYAAGARRGAVLAGPAGAHVGSACAGHVTFAGRLPGAGAGAGGAFGVSVRCGGLVATHLGLGALRVRSGRRVRAGRLLGTLGASGRLRLGARAAGRRHGYRDPIALLGGAGGVPRLGPAPRPLRPPGPRRAARRVLPRPRGAPARHVGSAPVTAWLGLAALGAGVGSGTVLRVRRRRARAGHAHATH